MSKTYVMSDIHGCYDEFLLMLEKVQFSDEDQLILAGDYIDRGTQSYEMLRWIENTPDNVLLIKGNHDVEFAQCIYLMEMFLVKYNMQEDNPSGERLYAIYTLVKEELGEMFDYYGTLEQLLRLKGVSFDVLLKWKRCVDAMPYFFKINIGGKKHIIVHAGYTDAKHFESCKDRFEDIESFYIYSREETIQFNGVKDACIVFGHTPTIAKGMYFNNGCVYEYMDKRNNCVFYNIDCGSSYRHGGHDNAKLACLRLDDKKVFYV